MAEDKDLITHDSDGEVQDNISQNSDEVNARIGEIFKENNVTPEQYLESADFTLDHLDPLNPSGLEDTYVPKVYKEKGDAIQDAFKGLYEGLVVNTIEGYGNLIPTVAQALSGHESMFMAGSPDFNEEQKEIMRKKTNEWTSSWIESVSGFADYISPKYSDEYYESDSMWTKHKMAQGLGQGVGFVAGIMMGGGTIAKGINAGVRGAKAVNAGHKVGSFIQGTNMMYPMVYEEAIDSGINPQHAARFALGVSGLVSLTEGAALDWIGKGISKPFVNKVTKEALKSELKGLGAIKSLDGVKTLEGKFAKTFMEKLKVMPKPVAQGMTIEAGQEFSQTYIEEGAKQLYDKFLSVGGSKEGEGQFGADVNIFSDKGWQTFNEALFGGAIGGIIGGGMPIAMSTGKPMEQETLFTFINQNVNKGSKKSMGKIDKLYNSVDQLKDKGEITPEHALHAKRNLRNMIGYANGIKALNMESSVPAFQMYQLGGLSEEIQSSVDNKFAVNESLPEAVASVYKSNIDKGNQITKAINDDMSDIVNNKQAFTKNKEKFEKRLKNYENLATKVAQNEISDEDFEIELSKITDKKSDVAHKQEKAKDKAKAEEAAITYKTKDGGKLTQSSLEKADEIVEAYTASIPAGTQDEFLANLEENYGIDEKGLTYLAENQGKTVEEHKEALEEIKVEKKEVSPDKVQAAKEKWESAKEKVDKQEELIKTTKGIRKKNALRTERAHLTDMADRAFEEYEETLKGETIEKKTPEKETKDIDALINQVKTQEDLTGKDLDAILAEADEKGITSPELIDEINKKRSEIAPKVEVADETVAKPKVTDVQAQEAVVEQLEQQQLVAKENGDEEAFNALESKIQKERETLSEMKGEVRSEVSEDVVDEIIEDAKESEPIKVEIEETPGEQTKIKFEDSDFAEQDETSFEDFLNSEESKSVQDTIDNTLKDDSESGPKKNQKNFPNSNTRETIFENPELYNKIKNHFRKIFPNISVTEVDKIVDEYGAQALARVVEKGIEIDKSSAFQHSIIHEYAHIYIKVLGNNDPIVQAGLEFIKDTQFYTDAKKLYPNLSEAEVREEALAEALANDSYDKLKVKFDGTALQKFVAFSKRFWNKVKRQFTKQKGKDIVGIISDGMTFGNIPYTQGNDFLYGVEKNQIDPKSAEITSLVQNNLTRLRLEKIVNPDTDFNPRSINHLRSAAYTVLTERYMDEKAGNIKDGSVHIFDGVNAEIKEGDNPTLAVYRMMESEMPGLFAVTNRSIESIGKSPLPSLEEVTDSAIKADQNISESIRSIITSIVDTEGNIVSADNIYRYVSNLATNTLGKKGFAEQLAKDAKDNTNIEAKRLNDMITQMQEGIRQSIISELSSLIQIEYRKLIFNTDADGNPVISNRVVNADEALTSELKDKQELIEDAKDNINKQKLVNDFATTMLSSQGRSNILSRNEQAVETARQQLSEVLEIQLPYVQFVELLDGFDSRSKNGKGSSSFMWTMADVLNGTKKPSDATGYLKELIKVSAETQALQNNFVNTSGNSVSSTRFGYFISELNSLMANKDGYIEDMLNSKLYGNNPVLKMINKNNKKSEWFVHDAISNVGKNKATEFSKQVSSDTILSGLAYFSSVKSDNHYYQSIGISGDRSHVTYFKAPRFANMDAIKKQQTLTAQSEQMLFDNAVKGLEVGSNEYNAISNKFDNMYMNKIVNGKVTTPFQESYPTKYTKANEENIKKIEDAIAKNELTEKIGRDQKYKSTKELVENYYYTEAINRNALLDIYGGPMLHRKSVADVVKRGSGINSGGSLIEYDKPVTIVVYDAPSEIVEGEMTSDSFSFDSPNLHAHTIEQSGDLGKVGSNKKDFIFQTDRKTGKMLMMKMSTLGVSKTETGTNLSEMSDSNFKGIGYGRIGNAIAKAEEYFANEEDGNPFVKFVDSKVMKGNEGDYKMININDLVREIENDNFGGLEKASFKQEILNHRVAFNLNKNLSKIPLSEQSVVLSTQLAKIALNGTTQEQLKDFENSVVDLLKSNLGVNNDYSEGKLYKKLNDSDALLTGLTNNADEQKANSISELLDAIQEHNVQNPNNKISVFDDPNLLNLVQQYVASKLTKAGIRADVAGAYLHMLPNYGNDLKWFDKEGGIPEIAVPWSMFANSLEEANALLAQGNLRTVAVRVPASGPMSSFVANVKYFTDGKANTVVTPDEFVKASDADHDADKVFVYREDRNDDGTLNAESLKNQLFNQLFERMSAEQIVKGTENSLSLDPIKAILKEYGLNKTESYKLSNTVEAANIAEQMGFGGEAIGILAIASKMLSVLSQSKESLNKPIKFGYELNKDESGKLDGKLGNETQLQNFKDDSINDIARLLQAALDMGNDPILSSTGINNKTISVATTLTLLGAKSEQIIGFLNNPAITRFNEKLSEHESSFSTKQAPNKKSITEKYIESITPPQYLFSTVGSLDAFIMNEGKVLGDREYKTGMFKTGDGKGFFEVYEDAEGKFHLEKIQEISEGDLAIINKYMEIQEIGDDIKKLIPVIQLDNKLPNTGEGNHNLNETFTELDKLSFSTNFLNRPLIQHYKKLSNNQKNIYRHKFITENPFFYAVKDTFAKSMTDRKGLKQKINDSFMMQIAQKQMVNKHSDPETFIYKFSGDLKAKMKAAQTGEVVLENVDKQEMEAVLNMAETKNNDPQAYADWLLHADEDYKNKYLPLLEQYEDAQNTMSETESLVDNKFLNALEYQKVDDKVLVRSKGQFRRATKAIKDSVREDFYKLPQEMQDDFVDYQLLRHGVNDKMGSLIDMMPQSLKINTLTELSNINKKKGTHLEENAELIENNTALSLVESMPMYMDAIRVNPTTMAFSGDMKYLRDGNDIFVQTNEPIKVGDKTLNKFSKITNQDFVTGKHFTKFGTKLKKEATDEMVDDTQKKCKG